MKCYPSLLLLLLIPTLMFAQDNRKGVYGNGAIGYGSYSLDLYAYAGGTNRYHDQTFSAMILSLGVEKKSVWTKNKLVFDIGSELTGGFALHSNSLSTGNISGKTKGGYALGLKGLVKMGYASPNSKILFVPLLGVGPYFNFINSGGEDREGNYMYGVQISLGAEFPLKGVLLSPEIHFGVASWGASDKMEQNGQPGVLEIKVKIAKRF